MPARRVHILLRNDDPCALSSAGHERRVLALFERYNVPHVAAVVPRVVRDPHDDRPDAGTPLHDNPAMLSLLREYQAKGLLEIAQHGGTHQTHRFRPSDNYDAESPEVFQGIAGPWLPFAPRHPEGYSEFSGLPLEEQLAKVCRGQRYLEEQFGTRFDTFIFPWNTFDANSLRAVRRAGFRCVLGGDDHPHVRGIKVVEACYWWVLGEDEYTPLVEHALSRTEPTLLHLSFHSWMLKDDDLQLMEAFLARFAQHPEIAFITPRQLPEVTHPVERSLTLRRLVRRVTTRVSRNLKVEVSLGSYYYTLRPGQYLKALRIWGTAAFIFATLGLTGWLLTSGFLAALSTYGLIRIYSQQAVVSLLMFLILVVAVYLFHAAHQLRGMRMRQHRAEGAG